jgi:Putative lumazine-binding
MIPHEETLMKLIHLAAVVLALSAAWVMPPSAQTKPSADRDAVYQAALDYVEGIYNVQPERIQRSVHPSLVKRGFYKKDASTPYVEMPMTYEQLLKLAGEWNKGGKRDTKIKEVAVLDVLDQTATAKVTAMWGVDYMLLGKYDDQWKIVQILWQSHPPK